MTEGGSETEGDWAVGRVVSLADENAYLNQALRSVIDGLPEQAKTRVAEPADARELEQLTARVKELEETYLDLNNRISLLELERRVDPRVRPTGEIDPVGLLKAARKSVMEARQAYSDSLREMELKNAFKLIEAVIRELSHGNQ
jgi:hypothetical protein